MEPFNSYKYLYPPRPEIKSTPKSIPTYERMGFVGQPKLNGSAGVLYTTPTTATLMNRHKDTFTRNLISDEDLKTIHRGSGYQVLVGEYMNKSKKDKHGLFNGVFVIFDILVSNGIYLTGKTFQERSDIISNLFPGANHDGFIDKVNDKFYKVKNFNNNFVSLYNEIIKIDMYEGWVLKDPRSKLTLGYNAANNKGWQLKIRKPTKNYSF